MTELKGQMQSSKAAISTVMELQCTTSNLDAPSTSSPQKLSQSDFRRVKFTEDSSPFPIPGLAADILHMQVKEGSKIRNLLRFATARMQEEGKDDNGTSPRQVVFTGSGRGVTKTITCVEILKRKVGGLHQVSKLFYKTVNEVWKSPQKGEECSVKRTVPAICILLSKDPLDPQEPGYQPPETLSVTTEEEKRHRALLRPAHSLSSHTAKRFCLHNWSVCSPQTPKDVTTSREMSGK
ncbi:ribonuclease P protein subunit p25-like protein [Notolabrus celidotus]|uniref:ribonuclease P protein subunit p25-like protein n=1 Tax=Notolabrus celidotus TaxID=1203425 RepID=UPI0014904C0F|nr:ribonuclease P protein subunit p25-like protein [Notolabrus celidotus]